MKLSRTQKRYVCYLVFFVVSLIALALIQYERPPESTQEGLYSRHLKLTLAFQVIRKPENTTLLVRLQNVSGHNLMIRATREHFDGRIYVVTAAGESFEVQTAWGWLGNVYLRSDESVAALKSQETLEWRLALNELTRSNGGVVKWSELGKASMWATLDNVRVVSKFPWGESGDASQVSGPIEIPNFDIAMAKPQTIPGVAQWTATPPSTDGIMEKSPVSIEISEQLRSIEGYRISFWIENRSLDAFDIPAVSDPDGRIHLVAEVRPDGVHELVKLAPEKVTSKTLIRIKPGERTLLSIELGDTVTARLDADGVQKFRLHLATLDTNIMPLLRLPISVVR